MTQDPLPYMPEPKETAPKKPPEPPKETRYRRYSPKARVHCEVCVKQRYEGTATRLSPNRVAWRVVEPAATRPLELCQEHKIMHESGEDIWKSK